jgi:hypothetical protein
MMTLAQHKTINVGYDGYAQCCCLTDAFVPIVASHFCKAPMGLGFGCFQRSIIRCVI